MSSYRTFGDMCWPAPGKSLNDLQWQLRYGTLTKSDLVVAASVLDAYSELVKMSEKRRRAVIRELRKGPTETHLRRTTP